jgi:hypothetical protein
MDGFLRAIGFLAVCAFLVAVFSSVPGFNTRVATIDAVVGIVFKLALLIIAVVAVAFWRYDRRTQANENDTVRHVAPVKRTRPPQAPAPLALESTYHGPNLAPSAETVNGEVVWHIGDDT